MTYRNAPSSPPAPPTVLPPRLAEVLRPELVSLAPVIEAEIRRAIPEYAHPTGRDMPGAIGEILDAFVDQIADPSAPDDRLRKVCDGLGQHEAQQGRSLDTLLAAYRVGIQAAWRRVMRVARRHRFSAPVMLLLADAVFAYMDRLSELSRKGYLDAMARSEGELEERRRRLLQLILERPAVPRAAIADLAEAARWPVPEEVTLVALWGDAREIRPALDEDLLVDLSADVPHLLIPGPLTAGRRAMLERATAQHLTAVGLTVPPTEAADSLRWARQALSLAEAGIIGGGRLILCEDHLLTLWLLTDIALVDELANRLIEQAGLSRGHRLIETLGMWLESRGTAAEIADRLHVHPQTVRYRIRRIKEILGDRLDDPDTRFALEVVLRAMRLRERHRTAGEPRSAVSFQAS
ncbi:DNA-binding transcriptional regulator, PucR family [Thermomonospora echinospora]|uniref:DNA-binding transcriptional regulator, PucR family n=1 Tax=Thermomonospora echinospora TaxID=1992 RepID=A0A1H6ECH1_9ACTN|nr:PucR family transcriptional regulator [Thermomonospora echinospora]SEG94594.1 DNA-binding transcriptional regulator, PucR family [Thermomonospora echinospora]